MDTFAELARQVETAWLQENNNVAAFTGIATKALKNFNYNWSLEKLEDELRKWFLTHPHLPQQMNVHNSFGQPSITVFNNNRFVVDLYLWVDFDTSIHSHGFRGAFRLLHGESLQETFEAPVLKKISEDICLVDLSHVTLTRLKKDDVQTIAPEHELTHRVIHLVNPTVTLCVKTINEPEIKQWNYLSTGLAIQKQNLSPDLFKKIYYYQYLLSRDEQSANQFLLSLLSDLNISTQIHIYESVASGSLELTEPTVDRLAETIVKLHEHSAWWPPYEKAHLDSMSEIHFSELQDPEDRLKTHLANCGYNLADIR